MDYTFGHFVWAFWWLIFPVMGFGFGAMSMLMGYRAHRDRMEMIKSLIAQGKNPDDIAKALGAGNAYGGGMNNGGPMGPGPWGGPPWAWGGWGYWGRWGPYREWRRFVVFTCLAVGFGVASYYAILPGTVHAFTMVAIIMGVLATGSLLFAIISTVIASNAGKNEK